ncbi:MAG: hypothetical protein II436_02155 [Oscillospiraceae bacterium]|nr:hypothetical protein [Oscillospiraceae bacterium]
MNDVISMLKEKLATIEIPQIAVLIAGIAALLLALHVAKTALKIVLFVVSALAALYFFYPSLYTSILGRFF